MLDVFVVALLLVSVKLEQVAGMDTHYELEPLFFLGEMASE